MGDPWGIHGESMGNPRERALPTPVEPARPACAPARPAAAAALLAKGHLGAGGAPQLLVSASAGARRRKRFSGCPLAARRGGPGIVCRGARSGSGREVLVDRRLTVAARVRPTAPAPRRAMAKKAAKKPAKKAAKKKPASPLPMKGFHPGR